MSEVTKKKTAPRKTAAKKKVIATAESPAVLTHQDVALLVFQLWVDDGRQHGKNVEN